MLLIVERFHAKLARFYPMYICENKFSGCSTVSFDNKERLEIHLHECPEDRICDIKFENGARTQCTKHYEVTKLYPGDYCESEKECYSGKRVNNRCSGNKHLDLCKDDLDCDVDLFCLKGRCEKLSENNCGPEMKCKSNLVCNKGKCILIGSLSNGSNVTINTACKSLYSINGKCRPGPQLNDHYRNKQNPEQCLYSDGNSESPVCAMTDKGISYCNFGLGDFDLTDVCLC